MWEFLQRLAAALKDAAAIFLGIYIEEQDQHVEEANRRATQTQNILDMERANAARPVAGAADRLRLSKFNRSKP